MFDRGADRRPAGRVISSGRRRSAGEPAEDQGDVLAAEAEAVRERDVDLLAAGLVGDVVEVAVVAGVVEVDRRRDHAVADRQQADDRLDAAGRRDQVAHHALGAGDGHLVGRVAEAPLDGQGLDRVVDRRCWSRGR